MRMIPDLNILLHSGDFVAVEKPAGLATIPGRAETDSVLERLGRQIGMPSRGHGDPRVRVVHRLDKETSGVLLFALNRPAQQHLSHQFQNNTVQKEYLALVRGRAREPTGEIDAPLSPHPTNPRKMAVINHAGRAARTLWQVEQTFRGFALLRCFPKTGKTHQIRVHLAHIGLPLAVDPLYAPIAASQSSFSQRSAGIYLSDFKRAYRPTAGQPERPLISRLTLHAEKLAFNDANQQRIEITCPLPKDFRALLNQLTKFART
jgi:23S rRNA pseudouridine955/2504/2580 synthase/23S rRNA pseudouridine1911/1915/1917 synthase